MQSRNNQEISSPLPEEPGVDRLKLEATLGFNGHVPSGLLVHPDRQHLIYPLGSIVIVANVEGSSQELHHLFGHTNDVTCVAVSKDGKYIASGQITHSGFKADIIVWDFETMKQYCKFCLHKVKVEALAFCPSRKYLLSLGGQDDGSVVVWDLEKKVAICGHPAQVMSAGTTKCITYANNDDMTFVTGGEYTLRVWKLDVTNRKIHKTDVNMGQVKRIVLCIEFLPGETDDAFFCGTTSGDILYINARTHLFQFLVPLKQQFGLGVTALKVLKNQEILVGAGDGTVALIKEGHCKGTKRQWICSKSFKVNGKVTSIALRGTGHQFFVGTDKSQVYQFNLTDFSCSLTATSHNSAVNDVFFPKGDSSLFATCAKEEVRIWFKKNAKVVELLRIHVENIYCNAVDIRSIGDAIISGWEDGRIRCNYPESGNEMFIIEDAHNLGVTSLACFKDGAKIVSGGGDGRVRVWKVKSSTTTRGKQVFVTELEETMKEHKASVSFISLTADDTQCISASSDGTCIVWDLERFVRSQIIFSNTLFKCIRYNRDENQVITCGTDRKIAYWETATGELLRELEGSTASINGMDISPCGTFYVTGDDNKMIKVWKYNEGKVTHVGLGHAAPIGRVKVSPDGKTIISISKDGAILIWQCPSFES